MVLAASGQWSLKCSNTTQRSIESCLKESQTIHPSGSVMSTLIGSTSSGLQIGISPSRTWRCRGLFFSLHPLNQPQQEGSTLKKLNSTKALMDFRTQTAKGLPICFHAGLPVLWLHIPLVTSQQLNQCQSAIPKTKQSYHHRKADSDYHSFHNTTWEDWEHSKEAYRQSFNSNSSMLTCKLSSCQQLQAPPALNSVLLAGTILWQKRGDLT